jgi:hypothetical protein
MIGGREFQMTDVTEEKKKKKKVKDDSSTSTKDASSASTKKSDSDGVGSEKKTKKKSGKSDVVPTVSREKEKHATHTEPAASSKHSPTPIAEAPAPAAPSPPVVMARAVLKKSQTVPAHPDRLKMLVEHKISGTLGLGEFNVVRTVGCALLAARCAIVAVCVPRRCAHTRLRLLSVARAHLDVCWCVSTNPRRASTRSRRRRRARSCASSRRCTCATRKRFSCRYHIPTLSICTHNASSLRSCVDHRVARAQARDISRSRSRLPDAGIRHWRRDVLTFAARENV